MCSCHAAAPAFAEGKVTGVVVQATNYLITVNTSALLPLVQWAVAILLLSYCLPANTNPNPR